MRVTITIRVTHERESAGDMEALLPIPREFGVRSAGGSQARIETRIEPPEAVAATEGFLARYSAATGGALARMLDHAPAPAASATLTIEMELPDRTA